MAFTINTRGTCVPSDGATLETFKRVQRETNRLLATEKKTLLRVDGKIGKLTVAAVNSIKTMPLIVSGQVAEDFLNCSAIASNASAIAANIAGIANSSGAPVVADPRTPIRDIVDPAPKVDPTTGKVDTGLQVAGFPLPMLLLAAAGVGGYIYYKRGAGKKPGKKRKPASKGKVKAENLLGSF